MYDVPSAAANVAANNTFPGTNAQLFAGSNYNFTSEIRDDASFNRVYDSANMMVQQAGQVAYTNTSLTPIGTYNATYSFDQDRAGGLAAGFTYLSTTAQVVDSYLGHQKVLQYTGGGVKLFQSFPTGYIQFWFAISSLSYGFEFLSYEGANAGIDLYAASSGILKARNAGSYVMLMTCQVNRWYFCSILQDVDAKTYTVSIDGNASASLSLTTGYTAGNVGTSFYWWVSNVGETVWIDGIDYTGATGFIAGRASIDLGQVGVYNATYSFESETMFSMPAGFAPTLSATGLAYVNPSVLGHHNTLRLKDTGAASTIVTLDITDVTTTLIAEYWVMSTSIAAGGGEAFRFRDSADANVLTVQYEQPTASLVYYSGAAATTIMQSYALSTWYHFRVRVNVVTDKFDIWINGILKASQVALAANYAEIDDLRFIQYLAGEHDYDALDLSTDAQYYPERSSWLFLNSSQSFPVSGSYSTMWQAWSAGVNYNAQIVPFEVEENVQLISESTVQTSWSFADVGGSWANLYSANFLTDAWICSASSGIYNITGNATDAGDAFIASGDTDLNTGYWYYGYAGIFPGSYETARAYFDISSPYLAANGTRSVRIWSDRHGTPVVNIYATGAFDEDTITWANAPNLGTLLGTFTPPSHAGYITFTFNSSRYIALNESTPYVVGSWVFESKEDPAVTVEAWENVGKFHRESGLLYCQTNTSETLTMTSPTTTLSLAANDRIVITLNTTAAHQLDLNLKNVTTLVDTFAISTISNPISTTTTQTFLITEAMDVTQLEITGLFDDTENLQVVSLVIERPVGFVYATLGPFAEKLTCIAPGTYTVYVYEGSTLMMGETISLNSYAISTITYSPFSGGQRLVSLFDPAGDVLDFYQFRCVVRRTYNNLTLTYNLTTPYFYADDGSTFNLNVTDKWGSVVRSYNDTVSSFISITLNNVFSLKIKNDMRLPTLLQLTRNGITQSEYAMSGEIVEYMLWNGTYQLNYTQEELNQPISINLDVTSASIYNISTAYRTTFFSCFTNDALGLPQDTVRLYLNSSRKSWGPVEVLGVTNITALDYIGDVQYSGIMDLSGVTEFNVFVNIATIVTNNLSNEQDLTIAISKNGTLLQNQTISHGASLVFRFTNGHYNLNCTWENGTMETHAVDVLASGTNLTTYTVALGTHEPDYTALYASQLYAYAAFGDTFQWTTNVTDAYAQFYSVIITNQLANDSAVFFQWNGITLRYDVPAKGTYPLPLYVPRNATYREWNGETQQFIEPGYVALSMNALNGEVLLTLGEYAPTPDYSWTSVLPPIAIFGVVIAFFVVYIVKLKRKTRGEYC